MKLKLLVVAVIAGAFAWSVAPAAADTGGGGGGPGAAQVGVQSASTNQLAGAAALSNQNAVNANTPSNTAGGNVTSGPSSANQLAVSSADAKATNDADTKQKQDQTQNVDSGSCSVGCGGAGAAQIGAQLSDTTQNAGSLAVSDQNAVNANSPANVAGGNITSGPSSANQAAVSSADSKASNDADTKQTQDQNQYVGDSSSCHVGCGGAGTAQIGIQKADTNQWAGSAAVSKQNAVNANVPVNIAGGNVTSGPSSANQAAVSSADSKASNDADTKQKQDQTQNVGGNSSCSIGCGGAGGAQIGIQKAETDQWAGSAAVSKQNAVNANVPVNIAGGDVTSGPSSANQLAVSDADSKATNDADTKQKQDQTQNVGGNSSCFIGCGGAGAAQIGVQSADTQQWAGAAAVSKQNAVNANVPVNIAGGNITSGPSSANQLAVSSADAKATNDADTKQKQDQTQNVGNDPSCAIGCGGAGGAQIGIQKAETEQGAFAFGLSDQNAVNANTPVNVAGGNITSGPSSANQFAFSSADAKASNDANTKQKQDQTQNVGGSSSCYVGCGGPGAAQIGIQKADTQQGAFAAALSLQNAVNSNAPHSVAGENIYSGPSSANQFAFSDAFGKASNDADTFQWSKQYQQVG
jgi:hypothetical protein